MDINKIYQGDCFDLTNHLDNDSVDLFVTSPPYTDIRKYGGDVAPL